MTTFQKQRIGKYILLDKLAVGGMAELYRAMITGVQGFEKLIAIKKILPHLANEEELVRSFIDEAKLAALLHHQNIVQIYDFGSLGDTYFIAMEYLLGKDCRIINSKAKEKDLLLELPLALLIVSRICSGLDYAHKLKDFQGKPLNIIHRDISPQNILITYEGDVKIVDFGIAKAASQTTMTQMGMIKGKVAYMSPEQAAGKAIDNRSDIFSCGIILYEMVTGTRMFSGDTMHILAKVRDAQFERPEEVRQDLPEKLLEVLYRSLAKDPANRYQTCGDMLTDLEECMQQLGVHPSANVLAKYMKILFAEEIIAEEQHMQEITRIGLMQEEAEAKPVVVPPPAKETAEVKTSPARDALKKTDTDETPVQPSPPASPKKTLYAVIAVAIAMVIALMATFVGNKDEPPPTTPTPTEQQQAAPEVAEGSAQVAPVEQQEGSPPAETPGTELYQQAMDALVAKRYGDSVKYFEKLLQLGPGMQDKIAVSYAEALVGQAEKLAKTDSKQATELLEKSTHINPDSEQAHFQLGMLYLNQKDYPKAIASFQNVIHINPKFPDTFFNLGFIYALSKDYARAEEMYKRVVELAPSYVDEALFNLALVQNVQGKKAECIANLEKAVAINPKNAPARNYLKKMQEASGANQ
ncbi:MAG: protein kinase [Proteobacteria bacterium]|nr:protein kinase [Pseudomonadota bacterium]MBU4296522.1 protein kinase [Pseudomonadota bacterium]MCG2746903.1 protein kinase [Desulfobulbaceae bacterium]